MFAQYMYSNFFSRKNRGSNVFILWIEALRPSKQSDRDILPSRYMRLPMQKQRRRSVELQIARAMFSRKHDNMFIFTTLFVSSP